MRMGARKKGKSRRFRRRSQRKTRKVKVQKGGTNSNSNTNENEDGKVPENDDVQQMQQNLYQLQGALEENNLEEFISMYAIMTSNRVELDTDTNIGAEFSNFKDSSDNSKNLLMHAAEVSNLDTFTFLLKKKAPLKDKETQGRNILFYILDSSIAPFEKFEACVNKFRDSLNIRNTTSLPNFINTSDVDGFSPFLYAIEKNNLEIVNFLLNDLSLHVNYRKATNNGEGALQIACSRVQTEKETQRNIVFALLANSRFELEPESLSDSILSQNIDLVQKLLEVGGTINKDCFLNALEKEKENPESSFGKQVVQELLQAYMSKNSNKNSLKNKFKTEFADILVIARARKLEGRGTVHEAFSEYGLLEE